MPEENESLVEKAEKTILESFIAGLKRWITSVSVLILSWFTFMSICVLHLPTIFSGLTDMGIIRKVDHSIGRYIIVQFDEGTKDFIPRTNSDIKNLKKENEKLRSELDFLKEKVSIMEARSRGMAIPNFMQQKGK